MHQLDEMLSFDDVAGLLSISRRTVQRLIASKALVPVYVSARRPRFRIEDIAAFRLWGIHSPTIEVEPVFLFIACQGR